MKKSFLILSTFLFATSTIAQNNVFSYGLKAGISIGKIAILPPLQNRTERYGVGVVGGGIIEIPIQKKMKVQMESLYQLHRSSVEFDPYTDVKRFDLSLHQVSIPVQVGYFITPNLSINAGASANYNFYFTQKVTLDYGAPPTFNITEEIIRFQPGLLGGISFYAAKNIVIDGRYHRMLTNLYHQPPTDSQTEYHLGFFQIAAGYRF